MGKPVVDPGAVKKTFKECKVKDNGLCKAVEEAAAAAKADDHEAHAAALEDVQDLAEALKKVKGLAEDAFDFLEDLIETAGKAVAEAAKKAAEEAEKAGAAVSGGKASESIGPVKESSYNVGGKTLEDVLNAINARSQAEAAQVSWTLPKPKLKEAGGKVTEASVTVPITMEMPNWTGASGAGKNVKAEWDRVMAALRKHEDGHVALVHEHFDGLADKMLGLSRKEAEALFDKAGKDLQKASDAYDAKTKHGETQGAVIDLDVED